MINKPTSKSIFKSIHNPLRVPAALIGGGPSGPFDPASVAGLQHRYLDGEPYQIQIGNRWFVRDSAGTNHAAVKTPCLRGLRNTNMFCNIGLFELTSDFQIDFWMKYEGTATDTNGPMMVGGGLSANGSQHRSYLWYRPSTNTWTFAVNGESNRLTVVNSTIEDNQWHKITLSRTGTTHRLLIDDVQIQETTGTVSLFSVRHIMMNYTQGYSLEGLMSDFRITANGLTTIFPLQDGEGNGTNRNIAWYRSDGASGVIENALNGSTAETWWAAKTYGQVPDYSINHGGRIGSNGQFVLGLPNSELCADGNAKTLTAGKVGNPFTRLNCNPNWLDSLRYRGIGSEIRSGQNINAQVAPFDSAFNRNAADGMDRILIYSDAKNNTDLTNLRSYTGTPVPTAWSLADLPNELCDEYIAAIQSNGGTISTANQQAVRNLMNGLHAAGLFGDVYVLYLYHGNTLNAARLNAVNPATHEGTSTITWVGSPILNPSGGITPSAGNYGIAFHPGQLGFTNTRAFSGAGLGFFSTSNAATSERTMGNTQFFHLSPKFDGQSRAAVSNFERLGTIQDLSGFHFATREPNESGVVKAYRNGVEYINQSVGFTAIYTVNNDSGLCHIGGCNDNGTANLPSTTPIRLSIVTRGLLPTQVADLNTLIQTYIAELV